MKTYGGVEVYLNAFLTPGHIDVSGQHSAPAALFPIKSHLYTLDRRLGGPQSRSGRLLPPSLASRVTTLKTSISVPSSSLPKIELPSSNR